uniref:RNA-binding protein with multiple splicing-like n=1 Tax=Scleropages formosus TaxID=113540 RepID=A0A8D0CKP9_SCLFO
MVMGAETDRSDCEGKALKCPCRTRWRLRLQGGPCEGCQRGIHGRLPPQVRTLFVSGLPVDIKPRELYLLFRPFKGYEGSLIKLTSKQVSAPALGSTVAEVHAGTGPACFLRKSLFKYTLSSLVEHHEASESMCVCLTLKE